MYEKNRAVTATSDYIPPDLAVAGLGGPASASSPRGLNINRTTYHSHRFSGTAEPGIDRASLVNVQFAELPVLNLYDLTRRSENFLKYKRGDVTKPDDLESSVIVDDKLAEGDLMLIEKEVNKANRKRIKDLKNNTMIPANTRTSV